MEDNPSTSTANVRVSLGSRCRLPRARDPSNGYDLLIDLFLRRCSAVPPNCPQQNTLLNACRKSTELYTKAVKEFSDKVRVAMSDDLELLWIRAEQAREVTIHTRELYASHIKEHGC